MNGWELKIIKQQQKIKMLNIDTKYEKRLLYRNKQLRMRKNRGLDLDKWPECAW